VGDPVAELRGGTLEVALCFLGIVPDVLPDAIHQHAHTHNPSNPFLDTEDIADGYALQGLKE
jgi:hypothetical protein